MATISYEDIISSMIILSLLSLLSMFILFQLCCNLYCSISIDNREQEDTRTRIGSDTRTRIGSVGSTSSPTSTQLSRYRSNSRTNTKSKTLRKGTTKQTIEPFFKNTTMSASFIFFMVCVSINADRILSTQRFWSLLYPAVTVWSFYFIGRMLLTLNFIGRLHYTFVGSVYAKSECTMRCLKISWCLMPIFSVLSIGMYPLVPILCYTFGSLVIFVDLVLSCVLLYVYIKTLAAIINGNSANQNTKLISFMVRYTLLYSISFTTTIAWIVFSVGATFIYMGKGEEMLRLLWIFTSIDAFFNSLTLWLNLQFANVWYFRLCACGHKACKLCFGHYSTADVKAEVKAMPPRINSKSNVSNSPVTINTSGKQEHD
eukprot:277869_1